MTAQTRSDPIRQDQIQSDVIRSNQTRSDPIGSLSFLFIFVIFFGSRMDFIHLSSDLLWIPFISISLQICDGSLYFSSDSLLFSSDPSQIPFIFFFYWSKLFVFPSQNIHVIANKLHSNTIKLHLIIFLLYHYIFRYFFVPYQISQIIGEGHQTWSI